MASSSYTKDFEEFQSKKKAAVIDAKKPEPTAFEKESARLQGKGTIPPALNTSYNIAAFPEVGSNPLGKFVSYNVLFTLSCIDKSTNNLARFDRSNIKNVIARTQGDWGKDNRVKTGFGQFDYFIDDVIIVSQPAVSTKTGETFATKITFKVTEPYSMGLFLDSLLEGSIACGYNNFREAPYLLMIEFVGYKDDNLPNPPDPSLTRFIPIRFIDVKFKVTSAGSLYECEVIPYNELAFRDPIANSKQSLNLGGPDNKLDDVKSYLDDLVIGLKTVVKNETSNNQLPSDDEILVHFPKSFDDPTDSWYSSEIAQSKIFVDFDSNGSIRFPNQDDIYDPLKQIYKNKSVTITPKKVFQFKQNTKIQDIITQIVLRSDYITKQLTIDKIRTNKKGMLKWFRIEVRVLDGDDNPVTNRHNRTIIYRVVPYEVHISKFLAPNSIPEGYDNLKKTVNRIYNYIYTGKNTEIINIDIDFNMAFFSRVSADAGGNTGTRNDNQSYKTNDKDPKPDFNTGTTGGTDTVTVEKSQLLPGTDSSGSFTEKDAQLANYRALFLNPSDMIEIKMTILGDPYFIPSSGMGNQIGRPVGDNIMEDGSFNYQSGEVDIVLNFRTPVDLDPQTGLYTFTKSVDQFSGLFQIFEVESKFNQNKFTQVITAQRRRTQLQGSGETTSILGTTNGR